VARIGLLHGIDRKDANGIDGEVAELVHALVSGASTRRAELVGRWKDLGFGEAGRGVAVRVTGAVARRRAGRRQPVSCRLSELLIRHRHIGRLRVSSEDSDSGMVENDQVTRPAPLNADFGSPTRTARPGAHCRSNEDRFRRIWEQPPSRYKRHHGGVVRGSAAIPHRHLGAPLAIERRNLVHSFIGAHDR
jgi:hypothetical protein